MAIFSPSHRVYEPEATISAPALWNVDPVECETYSTGAKPISPGWLIPLTKGHLPPHKVRDLGLDLAQTISFFDGH